MVSILTIDTNIDNNINNIGIINIAGFSTLSYIGDPLEPRRSIFFANTILSIFTDKPHFPRTFNIIDDTFNFALAFNDVKSQESMFSHYIFQHYQRNKIRTYGAQLFFIKPPQQYSKYWWYFSITILEGLYNVEKPEILTIILIVWILFKRFIDLSINLLYSPIISYNTLYLTPWDYQLLAKFADPFCCMNALDHA